MLSVGIVEKYRELSKVYSGKELVDRISKFVIYWKKEMKETMDMREQYTKEDLENVETVNLNNDSDDSYFSDDSVLNSGDYYYVGDVESGIVKVKSIFIGGIEYFVDNDNNAYDVLSFDMYGLLLQIGTYDCGDGRVNFVDPVMV
jgi:hypothetical protein